MNGVVVVVSIYGTIIYLVFGALVATFLEDHGIESTPGSVILWPVLAAMVLAKLIWKALKEACE